MLLILLGRTSNANMKRGVSHSESNGNSKMSNGSNGTTHISEQESITAMISRKCSDLFHYTFSPLCLISLVPNLIMLWWYTIVHCDGNFQIMYQKTLSKGLVTGMAEIWSHVTFLSTFSLGVVFAYFLWSLFLMAVVPGPAVDGPITPKGNIPKYCDNGFNCYVINLIAFAGVTYVLKQYGLSTTLVYDRFDEILCTLNMFSLVFCVFLYLKGLFSPSTSDHGSSGNVIFDYYWGTELYPRVFGIDIKVFTNCRFGMTVWPLLVLTFCLKSYELYGFVDSMFVCTALQIIYCTKFFWWEAGYMSTIDIMLDRAGFYICWGCLVFIPGFYCSTSLFMVTHPVRLGPLLTATILAVGILGIWINYWADQQKQEVRRTKGKCTIWGKKPEIIIAKYRVESGAEKESLLLVSGFWGISRHFHYLPELTLSLCWCLPALFSHVMPYAYFFYLTVLLTHRSVRDEDKCSKKYAHYWSQYCQKVPYRMLPWIY